jgi:hypothetical protein
MARPTSTRELALQAAERELGKPYIWGGNNPAVGWDCSGFVIECLRTAGVLPPVGDWTAAQLHARFADRATKQLKPGVLLFWRRGQAIGHVEMVYVVIGGRAWTIGASGGGPSTTTREAAIRADAFVRIRPAASNWVAAVDPFDD